MIVVHKMNYLSSPYMATGIEAGLTLFYFTSGKVTLIISGHKLKYLSSFMVTGIESGLTMFYFNLLK